MTALASESLNRHEKRHENRHEARCPPGHGHALRSRLALWLLICLWAPWAARAMAGEARWAPHADAAFNRLVLPDLRAATAIAQDGAGLMWIGTPNGLRRWDGYRARAYAADAQNPAALQDNFIQALHTDARGRLWVGTAAGGLARYDAEQDAFVNQPRGAGGLTSSNVLAIAAEGSGGLWLGTGAGLAHLDLARGVVRTVSISEWPAVAIRAVLQTPAGDLWLGTDAGLLHRAAAGGSFVGVALDMPAGRGPSVANLLHDADGRLWIGTESHGAFVLEPGAVVPRALLESGNASRLVTESIRSIVEVADGELWLGTNGGGIVAVDKRGQHTRRLRNHLTLPTSLADDDISLIFRDRQGLVWVGSTMALNVNDPRERGIFTLFGTADGDRAISSAQVPAVLVAPDGRAWLSLGNAGGVDIIDPVHGRVGQLRPDPSQPQAALPAARVLAMAALPDGGVFIGTRQGLYRADAQGRAVSRVALPLRDVDAPVASLAVDGGVLWLGGPDGLWALDVSHGHAPGVLRYESPERLGGPMVTAILRGSGSSLWVGTSVGVARVDVDSGAVEPLPADAADPTALPGNRASSLLQDAQGRLWVASYSAGLQVLERRDGDAAQGRPRFRRIGMREGLPHGGVDMMLADARGRIWVSTDRGLAVVDPVSFAVRSVGEAEGVLISKYWANAGARTAEGELLFGGQGGLTVVRPERVAPIDTPLPLVVTELRVGGKLLPAGGFNRAGSAAVKSGESAPAPRVDLAAPDRHLSVEFSALDYAAPEVNRYSYRLVGFDSDWISVDAAHRVAAYTNLPPGDYSLQLRGSRRDASVAPAQLDLPIRVWPAWYQTVWFQLMTGTAAVLAIVGLVQLRTRFLRDRQHQLQAQVNLRTAELQASQHQLELIAYADPLTGLDNRRRFNENLRHGIALALRDKASVTLLLIDLDHFKQINDSLGHDAGDALLAEVALRLGSELRLSDRIARLGGDEFAVLLAATGDAAEVAVSCQRLVDCLASPFSFGGHTMQIGASIGGATCPDHAFDAEALYKAADLALYAAKHGGRNAWRLATQEALKLTVLALD